MTIQRCWNCGQPQMSDLELDKRARSWLVRIRLYNMAANPKEPDADTDPVLGPEQRGTLVCKGIRGIVDAVVQLATLHHGELLHGLDIEALDAKIPGLRPTLSRRGGTAVWRLPYDTAETLDPTGQRKPSWLARIDLERIPDKESPAPKPMRFRRGET